MDTIGSLIDKLVTVKLKLRSALDLIESEETRDLILQHQGLVNEITESFEKMASAGGKIADIEVVQKKHKVY